jgi:hypothetical protein
MGRVEKILLASLVAILVTFTVAAGSLVVERATRCARFHFQASDWAQNSGARNETANRLAQCHRLDGLSAETVRARLGHPDQRFRRPHHGNRVWSYEAGPADTLVLPGVGQTLDIEYASDGRVRRATIEDLPAD